MRNRSERTMHDKQEFEKFFGSKVMVESERLHEEEKL